MNPKDRRRHPRFEQELPVDLLNMGDDPTVSQFEAIIPARAMDVSRKGMQLQANTNVPVGSFLSAILYVEGRESICLSEVVWKRQEMGQWYYGLFIKEWSKLDRSLESVLCSMETAAA